VTESPLVLVAVHPTGLTWIDVTVLAIFAVGIVLILLLPFTIDIIASHRTYRKLVTSGSQTAASTKALQGVQGLARATMAFAIIAVIGFALAYILVERPFADNRTITSNIVVALTTTLASITAFYFGSRLAAQAHQDATKAAAGGAGDGGAAGGAAAGAGAAAAGAAGAAGDGAVVAPEGEGGE
jgi:hypothetical protein